MSLTIEEANIALRAGELAAEFAKLPQMHPADSGDITFHVHAIQNIIMARSAQRTMSEQFPTLGPFGPVARMLGAKPDPGRVERT